MKLKAIDELSPRPNPETTPDADLLRRAAKGDDAAFLALYHRHRTSIFRFALHMSGRKEIAEEVTQEVFLSLVRAPNRYKHDKGPLQAFLLGIARNQVRRHFSRRQESAALNEASPAQNPDPFHLCAQSAELEALEQAILELPPRYREVIVLCGLQERPYEEAAQLIGCAVGTIRSRLHRARQVLTQKLTTEQRCRA